MEAVAQHRNPFATWRALQNSSYSAFRGGKLSRPLAGTPTPLEEFVHDSFRSLVLNPRFTCVAAKSAIAHDAYRIGNYQAMDDAGAIEGLAHDLYEFVQERPSFEGFSTFVATFNASEAASEVVFEQRLWSMLQRLNTLDSSHHEWDPAVSSDPDSEHFSFSFAGTAFFLVGLHPSSNRFTRRFAFPTVAFNAHSQFEDLRESGKYERMQKVIRARDVSLQGDINHNLSDFGERSEARHYSGRAVENEWRCPFLRDASKDH